MASINMLCKFTALFCKSAKKNTQQKYCTVLSLFVHRGDIIICVKIVYRGSQLIVAHGFSKIKKEIPKHGRRWQPKSISKPQRLPQETLCTCLKQQSLYTSFIMYNLQLCRTGLFSLVFLYEFNMATKDSKWYNR